MEMDDLETQWTTTAGNGYAQATEVLIAEVRRHSDIVMQRQGRQVELQAYFESVERLVSAVNAFSRAEFDWCGSFPLALPDVDERDDWDEHDEADNGEPKTVLSVVGRWDYRVTDAEAVIAAGRAAYLTAWPDDTAADAQIRVHDVVSAAAEITHARDAASLDGVAGLESCRSIKVFVLHNGEDDDAFRDDPFVIARPESDA